VKKSVGLTSSKSLKILFVH